jgi:hypothetical protein
VSSLIPPLSHRRKDFRERAALFSLERLLYRIDPRQKRTREIPIFCENGCLSLNSDMFMRHLSPIEKAIPHQHALLLRDSL